MLLERLYDDDLAHASYLIGCQRNGEAIVVDPRRDVQVYLDLLTSGGRGKEMAEHLRRERIGF